MQNLDIDGQKMEAKAYDSGDLLVGYPLHFESTGQSFIVWGACEIQIDLCKTSFYSPTI